MQFATQQRNGLLLYNGRFNERFDFVALEILNSTVRFSFSLGARNVTIVETGKMVTDGAWHTVEVDFSDKVSSCILKNMYLCIRRHLNDVIKIIPHGVIVR